MWQFSGDLDPVTNNCPPSAAPATLLIYRVTVQQSGAEISGTLSNVADVVMTGSLTPDGGFSMDALTTDWFSGCSLSVGFSAVPDTSLIMATEPGVYAFYNGCPWLKCGSAYTGTMVRLQ